MEGPQICPKLLDKIFSFLPLKDLLTARQICSTWRSVSELSVKRRIFFEVCDSSQTDFFLRVRDLESYGSAPQIIVNESQEGSKILKFPIEDLNLDSVLHIEAFEQMDKSSPGTAHQNYLPLLALDLIEPSWCSKISTLEFKSGLAVEDWNCVGTFVLSKFSSLKKLELKIDYASDYISTFELRSNSHVADFSSIREINIKATYWSSTPVQELNSDFVNRCPNLQNLRVHVYSGADASFTAQYCSYKNSKGIRFHSYRADISSSVYNPVAPLFNSTPFTNMRFNFDPCCLLGSDPSQSLDVRRQGALSEEVKLLLTFLHNPSLEGVEELHAYNLHGGRGEFGAQMPPLELPLKSPKISRLVLEGIDLAVEDADSNPVYRELVARLPNVKQLNATSYSWRLLKNSAEFKQLRRLVWSWKVSEIGMNELSEMKSFLVRHQALESLTLSLEGEHIITALEAVVEACAALPRMRVLEVLCCESADVKLVVSPRFKALQSRAKMFSLRFCFFNG